MPTLVASSFGTEGRPTPVAGKLSRHLFKTTQPTGRTQSHSSRQRWISCLSRAARLVPIEDVNNALRRYRVLKAMVQRERNYTKGYTNLRRLYELGILERGMVGSPQTVAQDTLDGLDKAVDMLGFLDIVSSFEVAALQEIRTLRAETVGRLRELVRNAELAPAAAGLLQNTNDPSWSLRSTIDVLRLVADASDTEYLEAINL